MKFFDFLMNGFKNYSIYSENPSTKNDNIDYPQNILKHPDKSVAIIKPNNFEDVLRFVKFVSGNRSAVVDFNNLCGEELQRCADFVSGAVCALNGTMQLISSGIYLFAPEHTKLMTNKRKKGR